MKKENTSAGDRGIVDSNTGVRQRNLQGGGGDGRGRNDGERNQWTLGGDEMRSKEKQKKRRLLNVGNHFKISEFE